MEVTESNFWDARSQFEKDSRKYAWTSLKLRCGISLAKSILGRLIISYLVVPSLLLFCLFLLEANSNGLVATLNDIFSGAGDIFTDSSAKSLTTLWHFLAFFSFALSWVSPWVSPVDRQVAHEMDRWWFKYGDKLPIATLQGKQR